MCSRLPAASARNQTTVIGPNSRDTFSVPCDCIQNSATSTAMATGVTACANIGCTNFRPSTADTTEIAGVITASP